MFEAKKANEIIRGIWERDKALPITPVMRALREAGQGRRTSTVSDAIANFLGPSNQPRPDSKAFPEESDTTEAVPPEAEALRKSPKQEKNIRKPFQAAVPETGNVDPETTFVWITKRGSNSADKLALLEERLLLRETENARLADELAQLTREAEETTEALAKLEGRLAALETDDARMLERIMEAARQRREAFPRRVTSTVSEILQAHGNLTVHDILEMLPTQLRQDAEQLRLPLNVPNLAEWLGVDLGRDGRRDTAVND